MGSIYEKKKKDKNSLQYLRTICQREMDFWTHKYSQERNEEGNKNYYNNNIKKPNLLYFKILYSFIKYVFPLFNVY